MFSIIDGSLVFSSFPIDPDTGLPRLEDGEAWIVQKRSTSDSYDLYLATSWDEDGKVLEYISSRRLVYWGDILTKKRIRKVANELMYQNYEKKRAQAKRQKHDDKYYASLDKESFWHVPKWVERLTDMYDNSGREKQERLEAIALENNPKYAGVYKSKESEE